MFHRELFRAQRAGGVPQRRGIRKIRRYSDEPE
jgi:hypothetical protein